MTASFAVQALLFGLRSHVRRTARQRRRQPVPIAAAGIIRHPGTVGRRLSAREGKGQEPRLNAEKQQRDEGGLPLLPSKHLAVGEAGSDFHERHL